MLLYGYCNVAHHLEAAAGYHQPTTTAAGEEARLAERGLAGCRLGCLAYALHILHPHKRVVNATAQHRTACPRNHPERSKRILVVVLVIRAALAAYQHAAAAATCPKVLRVRRPRTASEVAALLHQLASTARNAAGIPGPLV